MSQRTASILADETREPGDPDIGLVGAVGDQIHRVELLGVDDGKAALLRAVVAHRAATQHVRVLAHAHLLDVGYSDCK